MLFKRRLCESESDRRRAARLRRVLLSIAATMFGCSLFGIGASVSLADSTAPGLPPFCTSTGPIDASQLVGQPVSLSDCPIAGREVVLDLGNGSTGGGVAVPPVDGSTNQSDELTTTGDYELAVSNVAGIVSATDWIPSALNTPLASDPACSQSAYNLEGGQHWTYTDKWLYNSSTASRAGYTGAETLPPIRDGNTNMTRGINNCGYPEGVFSSSGAYSGDTVRYANIDAAGNCTSKFPDGLNVDSWLSFNNTNTLAETCIHKYGASIIEADTGFGATSRLVPSLTPSCSGQYDLESVATHEWGHAYGLAHETSGGNEVMYPYETPCAARRHLGEGDYNGMKSLY